MFANNVKYQLMPVKQTFVLTRSESCRPCETAIFVIWGDVVPRVTQLCGENVNVSGEADKTQNQIDWAKYVFVLRVRLELAGL